MLKFLVTNDLYLAITASSTVLWKMDRIWSVEILELDVGRMQSS